MPRMDNITMDVQYRSAQYVEEISTFCPVRFYLGSRCFDGLLDSLDSKGGKFFLLTEDGSSFPGTQLRDAFTKESRGDLMLGAGENGQRIPCRVRGMSIDEDGLFAYVGLAFELETDRDRRKLDEFIAALW